LLSVAACGLGYHGRMARSGDRRGKRSKSSERWLTRQRRDVYVKKASARGAGSRAHYKLEELDRRFRLLRSGQRVLELGAAPGGWTCYVEERIRPGGLLIAVDDRPVAATAETVVIEGRFGTAETDKKIAKVIDNNKVDLVLSDMAPNISGIRAADQARSMELVELAEKAADQWLRSGGTLVVKFFQGEGVDEWIRRVRRKFGAFKQVKPKASRPESREMFAVARQFRTGT
jgi:23S rRNA (uridine2552-2'-O)-methyltransferase